MTTGATTHGRRGLRTLFRPLSKREFLGSNWPDNALVRHGDPERFGDVCTDPRLASPQALARAHAGPIQTLGTARDGGHSQLHITRDQVATLRDRGMSLKFDMADESVEGVGAWTDALANDLCVGRSACYCQAIFSGKGERVALHFDSVEVFILQLRGRKRWRHAKNTDVRYPLNPWAPGVPSSLDHAIVAPDGFDPDVPTRTTILRPGSALFVPRGWWHSTEALDDDCLSLSIMIHTPTWLELGMAAIRRRLMASEQWRRPISHDLASAAGLIEFVRDAERMLADGCELAGQLAAMDLAPARPKALRAAMRLARRADVQLHAVQEDGRPVVCVTRPGVHRRLAVGCDGAELCRWIAEREREFSVRAARAVVPSLNADPILLALIRLGCVELV